MPIQRVKAPWTCYGTPPPLWLQRVTMVGHRLFSPSSITHPWAGSEEHHPGDVNQALIELGSTVCKVRDPGCKACPLNTYCSAFIRANSTTTSLVAIDDIEDLCTICEPLPEDSSVTIYPLKAVKKKAREELDIVNVVEWRSSEHSTERQILLVKRPSKGRFLPLTLTTLS